MTVWPAKDVLLVASTLVALMTLVLFHKSYLFINTKAKLTIMKYHEPMHNETKRPVSLQEQTPP